MDYEESGTRIFKLKQDGRDYILSISIFRNCVRLSFQEYLGRDSNFYESDFSMEDLASINRYFLIISSIKEAQNELIKAIEKQQVGIEHNLNLTKIIFYISIGTDNINFKLPLMKKDKIYKKIKTAEEQEPFNGTIRLKNRGNYPEDEQRINILEQNNDKLKVSQKNLIMDIQKLMNITEKLIRESNLLYEENAKLKVRLQKIQKENNERNLEVEVLKDEEQSLNDENIKLKNYNLDLEKLLYQKKEALKRGYKESLQNRVNYGEIDHGNGPRAISSRYDETNIKTYIPRASAKPIVGAYQEGLSRTRYPFFANRKRNYFSINIPKIDRLNNTDIDINGNNNPLINSSNSPNTYNKKTFDTNIGYGNEELDKDPQDNLAKLRQKQKLPAHERIIEKTNDIYNDNVGEVQNKIENRNYLILNDNDSHKDYNPDYENFTQSYEGISEIKDTDSYAMMQNSGVERYIEYEEEDEELNYLNSEIIQSSNEEEMLLNKINKHGNKIQMNLLYKATVDTDRAEIFHQKCDQAQRTLILIETIDEKRFGGYTTQSWEGDGIDKNDDEAFVFSLDKLQIYNIISGQPAIGCYPKYGPVFLGCQIKINDNFFVKGGTTFKRNTNYATNSDFELNDGIKFFAVKDIEVFEVNFI